MSNSPSVEAVKNRFGVIGQSSRLIQALEVAIRVAPTEVTVLIHGENGTGKDIFSRIIQAYSRRKHAPFMAINCGAIPEGTMDSELFGHEKGSFTSAIGDRKGYFEETNGGTIFLDEIGEMSLATQTRLLRLLESGEYLRVGSNKIRKTDVRVVAATNKNLIEMIRNGKFREDLFYRLNTVSIYVPPLRERGEDIEMLFSWFANEFAEKYNRSPIFLEPEAADLLYQYRWPGNVRELRNFVEKLTVLIDGNYVEAETVSAHLNIRESYLPSIIANQPRAERGDTNREIDLLYKLIMDLREEVGDLKKLLFMGFQQRGSGGNGPGEEEFVYDSSNSDEVPASFTGMPFNPYRENSSKPAEKAPLQLEESLSLEKKEKELIQRALKKHGNNRKKAAQELGISERTLYRKIKNYEIA